LNAIAFLFKSALIGISDDEGEYSYTDGNSSTAKANITVR